MTTAPKKRICVVGLGYIGLPTACLLANLGHEVLGVDISERVVDLINRGEMHIKEPGLENVLQDAVKSGRLTAGLTPAAAEVFVLAVPTPFEGDHAPDMSYVEKATRSIAPHVKNGDIVILESTSPVGATEDVAGWLSEANSALAIGGEDGVRVAHCPERVLPGRILVELIENDRIVGGIDETSTRAVAAFYRSFVKGAVLETTARAAELAKLTENAFRDVNIAFANELSMLSEQLGVDVWEVIALANHHPRVNILNPGCGVGGHCIAVDPWFIVDAARGLGRPGLARLIATAREVNDAKPGFVVEKVRAAVREAGEGANVLCLGLTYKPDVDDTRESPAAEIAHALTAQTGFATVAVDPWVDAEHDRVVKGLALAADLDAAIAAADVIVALVPHQQFREIPRSRLEDKTLIDACGLWR